jgi:pantoate--beta-alanine ligase
MEIIDNVKDMQVQANKVRRQGKTIAFVPTMGFLHNGHISLIKEGKKSGDILVLSIFVNPAQFGPNEDFDSYPKNLAKDLELAEKQGVDIVFTPDKEKLYQKNYQTYVDLNNLTNHLCGLYRPGFFKGVTTVVTKLFNIVKPHYAVFGEKDYQQLAVIRQMVKDLNFDIKIIGSPTLREEDGLAMSSRNSYLTKELRPAALSLYNALIKAKDLVKKGEKNSSVIINAVTVDIKNHKNTKIEYISLCNLNTLEEVSNIEEPVVMALAVNIKTTRLIDNMILTP